MNRKIIRKRISATLLLASVWLTPIALIGQQTRIVMPKNKYKVQEDVKLGNDAARKVEQQFPIIYDRDAEAYLDRVGEHRSWPRYRQSFASRLLITGSSG